MAGTYFLQWWFAILKRQTRCLRTTKLCNRSVLDEANYEALNISFHLKASLTSWTNENEEKLIYKPALLSFNFFFHSEKRNLRNMGVALTLILHRIILFIPDALKQVIDKYMFIRITFISENTQANLRIFIERYLKQDISFVFTYPSNPKFPNSKIS